MTEAEPELVDRGSREAGALARYLVGAGKVAPSLTVDADGRGRARWVPMPAMGDRELLATLVGDDSVAGHAAAADALAAEVDGVVRHRLVDAGARVVARRAGRRTVPHAWLEALSAPDPRLSPSLDAEKVAAFAEVVQAWVATGAVAVGQARLCLRVGEVLVGALDLGPDGAVAEGTADGPGPSSSGGPPTGVGDARWAVELLVQDADEPSLMVPMADLWEGRAPFPSAVVGDVLASLGRMARVAPELSGLLDVAEPTAARIDTPTFLAFARDRVEALADVGISVQLPTWWARRGRVALRARARSTGAGPAGVVTESGFGLDQLVSFTWEAALGDERLTKAEVKRLARAAEAKQALVQVRGQWVQVEAAELTAVLDRLGTRHTARAGDLLRAGLGLDDLDAPPEVEVGGVVASGWLGRVLDDALHATVTPVPTPDTFTGRLRPYQERGVGWLAFLGRLGLGACLPTTWGWGRRPSSSPPLWSTPSTGPPW